MADASKKYFEKDLAPALPWAHTLRMKNEIEIVMTFGSSKVSEKLKTAGIDDETLDRKVNDILEKESLKRKKNMDYYEILRGS